MASTTEGLHPGHRRFRMAVYAVIFTKWLEKTCCYKPWVATKTQGGTLWPKASSKLDAAVFETEVKNQEQWEDLLNKEGLIVVDAYAAWCGPCKAIVSSLKRLKNEIGDDLLHFATAETDSIDQLELYRMKSQPTFLFYAGQILVNVVRACNCPRLLKTIKNELEREHKVLEGMLERKRYVDQEVLESTEDGTEKVDESKEVDEDEEIAEQMTKARSSQMVQVVVEEEPRQQKVQLEKQVTVAIIKPDAVQAGLVNEIIQKVEEAGLEILKKEEKTLTKEEATEFYKQQEGSEHFEQLVEFMCSGPCVVLAVSKAVESLEAGDGAVEQFRDLLGPKDVNIAKEEAPNSLRALYGTDTMMNAVHGCDSAESAARELGFFFPDFAAPTVTGKRKKRKLQRTLALIRPDAYRTRKESIVAKIEEAGFTIAMSKEFSLTKEQAEEFYAEHKDTEFFETLVSNMSSGPMLALCLAREDAVEGWRDILGPKEVKVAVEEYPDSLRAQFQVEDSPINPLHGSDSLESAASEINKIFPMQSTVAVIKPETEHEQREAIVQKIKEAGFNIQLEKEVTLTKELASQFYQEHEGKEFYNGLTDYMSSGPTMFLVLSREDAVSGWRTLMGPTDPEEAKESCPETLRALFGKDVLMNVVHGSSNTEKAHQVIKEFFPEAEILPDGTVKGPEKDKEEEGRTEEEAEAVPEVKYDDPLGMEDSKIPDEAIIASSELDEFHGPARGRLNTKPDGEQKGAWAAKENDENQWLQVDLGKVTRVAKVASQGEAGESSHHVTSFSISHSLNGQDFSSYQDGGEVKVFEGNSDQESIVTNELTQPVITQFIRVNPRTWNEQIALRAELYGFDAEQFTQPLGMEDSKIPEEAISASSVLDEFHEPGRGRLNTKPDGDQQGAWAAKDNDENQWLQVDLGKVAEVTRIGTQGSGDSAEHRVTTYTLSYSQDGENFTMYEESAAEEKVFEGNTDSDTVVHHWLSLPFKTRFIRIQPKTWNEQIALRAEFYGCAPETQDSKPVEVDGQEEETHEKEENVEQPTAQEGGQEKDQTPQEGGQENDQAPQEGGQENDQAPQEGGQENDGTPQEGGQQENETPQESGQQDNETPQESGQENDETSPEEEGKNEQESPKDGGEEPKQDDQTATQGGEEETKQDDQEIPKEGGEEEKGDEEVTEGEGAQPEKSKPEEGGEGESKPGGGGESQAEEGTAEEDKADENEKADEELKDGESKPDGEAASDSKPQEGGGSTMKSKPLVMAGPSGCGKSTLMKKLLKEYPDKFGFSVSHTTRSPRPGEVNGREYHFTDCKTMQDGIDNSEFIESAEYNQNLYGTSRAAVQDVINSGKVCLLDIDMQGVINMKNTDLDCLYVFIKPPSIEELEKRLRGRGTETEESLARRLEIAKKELIYGEDPANFDHVVINDDLEHAYVEFKRVISEGIVNLPP